MRFFLHYFSEAPLLAQVLGLLQLGFTIWMLVDAYHRRVEMFWYWVILWFQPLGSWAYFFAIKVRTLRVPAIQGVGSTEDRKLSLVQLRFNVERAPTTANRFALAERLMATGAHAEAIPLLETVLKFEPNYCSVLHALAKCRIATNQADQALAPLQRLLQKDSRWSNYLAWQTLVEVHQLCRQPAEALSTCRELARLQPTLKNKCLLAEHLLGNNSPSEAMQVLHEGLEEHRFSPMLLRWQNRRWAREARRLRMSVEQRATL